MSAPEPQPPGEPPNTRASRAAHARGRLAAFEADDQLCAALGPWLVETFTKLKRAEWERYAKTVGDATTIAVTPCELDYYLLFF